MIDPYIDPQSGVLRNRFGLADQQSLDRAEANATEKHGGPNLNHRRLDGRFVVLNAHIVAYSVTMCNYICL